MRARKNKYVPLQIKASDLRKQVLEMIVRARGTHIASALSIVDLVLFLYKKVLHIYPKNPKKENRDIFILSKGHGCAALYVVLAEMGFFPRRTLDTFTTLGSILGGHPDSARIPGVEASTGSLGHGFSVSVGFAMANKMNGKKSRVYCLVGDEELNEGSNWEAVQVAAHHKLDNLILVIDFNKVMISGFAKDILDPLSFVDKFKAFGWNTVEINGHDFSEMDKAFEKVPLKNGRPTVVVANTIKGKGVSFMENQKQWYSLLPNPEEMTLAIGEIDDRIERLKVNL